VGVSRGRGGAGQREDEVGRGQLIRQGDEDTVEAAAGG